MPESPDDLPEDIKDSVTPTPGISLLSGDVDFDLDKESAPLSATTTTRVERDRAFKILFLCQLAGGMGQTLVYAVLPPIARRLGMSEFETTMIYSLSAFLWIVTSPFWGRRSDIVGRKPIMLLGLGAFAISTTIFACLVLVALWGWLSMTIVFPLLMVSRAIFGGFGSGNGSAAQAYVADRTSRGERAAGVASLGAAFGIGTAIGPGVAAGFAQIHIVAPFFAVAAVGFISAGLIWFYLPERTRPSHRVSVKQEHRRATLKWNDRLALPWVVVSVIISFAQTIIMQLCAFYFIDTLKLSLDGQRWLDGDGDGGALCPDRPYPAFQSVGAVPVALGGRHHHCVICDADYRRFIWCVGDGVDAGRSRLRSVAPGPSGGRLAVCFAA